MSACCASCAAGGPCGGGGLVVGGRGVASGAPRELRQVDDALSSVWSAVRDFVPYGNVIDQAHQARRRIMYGDERPAASPAARAPRPRAPASGGGVAAVRAIQRTVRMAAKGDAGASSALASWKRAASSSPAMRRKWAAAVAVMRDDDRRIDARFRARVR